MRALMISAALLALATPASAQFRLPIFGPTPGQQPPGPAIPLDPRAQFIAAAGADTIYFAGRSDALTAQARATLAAQAAWLRANPQIAVRVEGYADQGDTRDHAIALAVARADAARQFLLLNGVPAAQVALAASGKERLIVGGVGEAAEALNRRVVTVLVR